MTYRQMYQDFLERIMLEGGPPGQIKATVAEYNAIENPYYIPTSDFGFFLIAAKYTCSTCRQSYTLPLEAKVPVRMKTVLDQETVCEACGADT